MKTVTTRLNYETMRKLEKALEHSGVKPDVAFKILVENGPKAFYALVGGVHH